MAVMSVSVLETVREQIYGGKFVLCVCWPRVSMALISSTSSPRRVMAPQIQMFDSCFTPRRGGGRPCRHPEEGTEARVKGLGWEGVGRMAFVAPRRFLTRTWPLAASVTTSVPLRAIPQDKRRTLIRLGKHSVLLSSSHEYLAAGHFVTHFILLAERFKP